MMSSLSHSTAIIPYSPPICPSKFIKQEVEKNFHSNLLKKKDGQWDVFDFYTLQKKITTWTSLS
jgi:hypothetical protein